MGDVYKEILNERYANSSQIQKEDIRKTKLELEQTQLKLGRARELLIGGDIEASDFRAIKAECEKAFAILEAKLSSISVKTTRITVQLDKAVKNLSNLNKIYEEVPVRKKKEILGSIFPEK